MVGAEDGDLEGARVGLEGEAVGVLDGELETGLLVGEFSNALDGATEFALDWTNGDAVGLGDGAGVG